MTLATIADYEAITGVTLEDPSSERDRVELLLDLASSAVLAGAHGQNIESADYTDEVLRPFEGVAYFTQFPVTDVASVAIVDAEGNETALTADTDYRFTSGGNGRAPKLIRRRFGRDDWWGNTAAEAGFGQVGQGAVELKVTYTAGWDPIPGPIVAATVALVVATMANAGSQASTSQTVGPFAKSYDASEMQAPSMALTPSARKMLDGYCKTRGMASVPVSASAP